MSLIPSVALANGKFLTEEEKIKLATKINGLQLENRKLENRIVVERDDYENLIGDINKRLDLEKKKSNNYQQLYQTAETQRKMEKTKKWLYLVGGVVVGYGLGQLF
jgi:hypothetical protein